MNITSKIAALAITALSATAQASTVTFDSQATSAGYGFVGNGTTYSEAGLTFTSASANGLVTWGAAASQNPDAGGATLFENYVGSAIVVTATGGGSFTLNSLDIGDVYNQGSSAFIPFAYTDASGTHTQSLALDGQAGLQTLDFHLTGLTSFTLTQNAPYFQIDNVVFNAATVPEPGSLGLMLAGIAMVGVTLRRRQA